MTPKPLKNNYIQTYFRNATTLPSLCIWAVLVRGDPVIKTMSVGT